MSHYNITSLVIDWSVVSSPPPSFPLLVGLRILRALARSLLFLPSLTPSSGVVLFIPPISTRRNDQLMQHMLMGGSTLIQAHQSFYTKHSNISIPSLISTHFSTVIEHTCIHNGGLTVHFDKINDNDKNAKFAKNGFPGYTVYNFK